MNNEQFIKYLFKKYLNRTYFTRDELNFHLNEINLNIKTRLEKEEDFRQSDERVLYLNSKILNTFSILKNNLSKFDIYYIKYIILKFSFKEDLIFEYFKKYSIYNKIAVVYSGHIRHFLNTNAITQELFLKKLNPDIFFHTWKDFGFQNKNNQLLNIKWLDDSSKNIDLSKLKILLRPKDFEIEDWKTKNFGFNENKTMFYFFGQAKDNASKYINSQLYSINRGNLLKSKYEKNHNFTYDLVVRMRFDFAINREVNFEDISNTLFNIRKNKNLIYIAHPINSAHGHPGGGGGCSECVNQFKDNNFYSHDHSNDICDIIAVSSSKNMNFYSDLFFKSEKVYDENSKFNINNVNEYNLDTHISKNIYYIKEFGDAIEKHTFCYYPEKLLKKHLEKYCLINDTIFYGELKR